MTAVEFLAERYNYITWMRNRDEISAEKADEWRAESLEEAKIMEEQTQPLSLQTKLEMFYDFLFERGIANQINVGIDTIVKHFIDERLSGNDR